MMVDTSRRGPTNKDRDVTRSPPIDPAATGASAPSVGGIDSEERFRRIAEAAYYRAERREFCPGCELEDWLEAERAIDDQLRLAVFGGEAAGRTGVE